MCSLVVVSSTPDMSFPAHKAVSFCPISSCSWIIGLKAGQKDTEVVSAVLTGASVQPIFPAEGL